MKYSIYSIGIIYRTHLSITLDVITTTNIGDTVTNAIEKHYIKFSLFNIHLFNNKSGIYYTPAGI